MNGTRLLKPRGIVAFSTMNAGSPSAGRLFRECAADFGLTLDDPSESLGTKERCRSALEAADFEVVQITQSRVDCKTLDPVTAWEANFCAAGRTPRFCSQSAGVRSVACASPYSLLRASDG